MAEQMNIDPSEMHSYLSMSGTPSHRIEEFINPTFDSSQLGNPRQPSMPLTLTYIRVGQHPRATPTAARAWIYGGARRKRDLAIGFHAAINSSSEPFNSMTATAPPVHEGHTVFEGHYRLPVAFRNEVDNVEAELTALCMLLLRLLPHKLYEVDVYTDCAALLGFANLPTKPSHCPCTILP